MGVKGGEGLLHVADAVELGGVIKLVDFHLMDLEILFKSILNRYLFYLSAPHFSSSGCFP